MQDAKSHAMAGDLSLQGIRLPGREMEVRNYIINIYIFHGVCVYSWSMRVLVQINW
jgi:hypothetical protein